MPHRSFSRDPGSPAVPALFALALGIAAALVAPVFPPDPLLLALGLLAAAAVVAASGPKRPAGALGALVLCALCGFLRGRSALVLPARDANAFARSLPPDTNVRVVGRIAVPWSATGSLRAARLDPEEVSVDGRSFPYHAPITVVTAGEADPAEAAGLGEKVRVEGPLRLPDRSGRAAFPFALPPQPRLVLKSALQVEKLDPPTGPLAPVLALHDALHLRLVRNAAGLPAERRDAVALAEALLLGETAGVPARVSEAFRDGGVAHVLSISGLHVALVAALLAGLLRLLPLGVASRDAALLFATCAYAVFAGGRPPVLRAALMIGIYLVARLLGRPTGIAQVMGLSAFVLLLADPGNLLDLGFLLTYAAVFGIVAFGVPAAGRLQRWGMRPAALAQGIGATLGAEMAVLPIQASAFQVVPFVGLLSNLLVVPLASLYVWAALLVMPLLAASPAAASAAALPLALLSDLLLALLDALDSLAAFRFVPTPSFAMTFALAGAILGAGLLRNRARRAALLAAGLLAGVVLLSPAAAVPVGTATLRAVDVGQGDSWLLATPQGSVLVDGGGTVDPEYAFGRLRLLPKLADAAAVEMEAVVLTHPHPDHARGLVAVLAYAPVGRLVLASGASRNPFLDEVLAAASRRRVPIERREAGEHVVTAGLDLEVLHPGEESYPRARDNNGSLVLRVALGSRRALLTGDVEALAESDLLARGGDLSADVLKVPHHGSRTSTTPLFLRAVHPRVALIGVGRRNRFGHPSGEVLARLGEARVRVFRTDRDGDLTLLFTRGRILPLFPEEAP